MGFVMKKLSLLLAGVTTVSGLLGSAAAIGHEKGDWLVRAGAATVSPDESSSAVSTQATGPIAGTSVGVDNDTQLGLNFVYMATDNIGIELLAATPFQHDLTVDGLAFSDLGSTKHLPPTLSAQYYFGNAKSTVRPYVRIGINYTVFFSEDLSGQAKNALGASNLELDDSVGLAVQAGIDWQLDNNWFVNASVWNMDIETEATFNSALGKVKADVDIDPWAYMIAVGYKF